MKVRDEELLARLRALGSKAREGARGAAVGASVDAVRLLGLTETELTPSVRQILHSLIEELAELRDELITTRSRLAELERLADEDALAPISNRRAFLRHLARTIGYVERYGAASSLLYFDLNGLKSINDSFGHAAGDAALVHVAQVLLANTRSSDLVGRLGGDEFGVLLARADDIAAQNKARRLAEAVTDTQLIWEGKLIPVSIAHGAYCLLPGQGVQEVLVAADRAMYQQKRGRLR